MGGSSEGPSVSGPAATPSASQPTPAPMAVDEAAAAPGGEAAGSSGRAGQGGVQGGAGGSGRGGGGHAAQPKRHGSGGQDEAGEDVGDGLSSDDADDAAPVEPDPFYDPNADDNDDRWANTQRSGYVSDAILSCPGCFTTLCIDCQRHEKYHSQYRAMFVLSCTVEEETYDPVQAGAVGAAPPGRGGRRPKRAKTSSQYQRVRCANCTTEVGAYDKEEEMYHFYHVFPSNA